LENVQLALVQTGLNRMRPIALTTLTTILALPPLALDIGRGAAMQQLLVLIVMPVIYYLLMRGWQKIHRPREAEAV